MQSRRQLRLDRLELPRLALVRGLRRPRRGARAGADRVRASHANPARASNRFSSERSRRVSPTPSGPGTDRRSRCSSSAPAGVSSCRSYWTPTPPHTRRAELRSGRVCRNVTSRQDRSSSVAIVATTRCRARSALFELSDVHPGAPGHGASRFRVDSRGVDSSGKRRTGTRGKHAIADGHRRARTEPWRQPRAPRCRSDRAGSIRARARTAESHGAPRPRPANGRTRALPGRRRVPRCGQARAR